MSLIEIAKKRYSVRDYKNIPVEREKLLQILEAGRIAPSAVNYQPWHFIVITDEDMKIKVAEAYSRDWFKKAPAIIIACGDHSRSWKRRDGKDFCDIDIAISLDHISLAATELGLGTCWICAFDAVKCHSILNLPENIEVIALMPVGYAEDVPQPEKKRKSIEEIVSWDSYLGQ